MNILCPNVSRCDCENSPLGNFSSEAPDELTYYAMSWITPKPRIGQNPDDAVGPGRPPVICGSTTSPTAAQQCADRDSYIDSNNHITPNLPVVFNGIVSCIAFCPDGSFTIGTSDPATFVNQDASVANGQAQAEACRLAVLNRICLSNISGQACVGTLFSVQIVASSTSPCTFSIVSGSLPPGVIILPLSPTSIFLAGVPTTAGNYSFNLRAANTSGFTAIKAYTISVMGIVNTSPLADATEGDAYVAIFTASGGTAPYSFGVVVGALPAGISLDPSGLLQGTPTVDGDFNFTVEVTDSAAQTCRKAFQLEVQANECPAFDSSTITAVAPRDINGDKDAALGRLLVGGSTGHELYNASNNLVISVGAFRLRRATWISSTQKFCFCPITPAGGYVTIDGGGASSGVIGGQSDLLSSPDYASDDDACYGIGYSAPNSFLTRLVAATEIINLSVGLGSVGVPQYSAYSISPKCLASLTTPASSKLRKYSVPGGVLGGTIDLLSPPYTQHLNGLIYHPASSSFWVTAERAGNVWLLEVNPTTWVLAREIDLGVAASVDGSKIERQPGGDSIFVQTDTAIIVANVTDGSVVCSIPVAATTLAVAYSQAMGRLYNVDDSAPGKYNIFI